MTTEFDTDAIAAGESRVLKFRPCGIVYAAGEHGCCAYIIKSGHVELRQKRGPVEILRPGEIFGEVALLDGGTHTASAVALDAVELIPIDAAMFGWLIRDDEEFMMAVLQSMARRHRATIDLFQRCLEQHPAADHAAAAPVGPSIKVVVPQSA